MTMPVPARVAVLHALVDRLAQWGARVLWAAVILAILGGILLALPWAPATLARAPAAEPCPNPPCFLDSTMPGLMDLPVVLPVLGFVAAVFLGGPSLVVGGWDLAGRRWRLAGRRMLAFMGPLLVLIGMEIVPHLLNPCLAVLAFGRELSGLCSGWDVADRWHALHHAVVGGLPLVLLYAAIFRSRRAAHSPGKPLGGQGLQSSHLASGRTITNTQQLLE